MHGGYYGERHRSENADEATNAFLQKFNRSDPGHSMTLGICMGLLMGIAFGLFDSGQGGNKDE